MIKAKPVVRRSHIKSRNGCESCKRRRVKCDEFRPTCYKCMSMKINPCVYQTEQAPQSTSSDRWPTSIEDACANWRISGEPPFPTLSKSPGWHTMPMADLKYLYQTALAVNVLDASGTSGAALFLAEFRTTFQLAASFDYVAHMLASASATRLALLTKSHQAYQDAFRFQGLALRGLNQVIPSFSKENADAILATALGCSFQMPDCRSLRIITEFIFTAACQMRPWARESAFCHLFEDEFDIKTHDAAQAVKGFDTTMGLNERILRADELVQQGIESLNNIAPCFRYDRELAAAARQLRDALRLTQGRNEDMSVHEQYRLVFPFTAWFTKNATSSFITLSKREPLVFVFMSHFYAVAVALVLALPGLNFPFFASMRCRGIVEIGRIVERQPLFLCIGCNTVHSYHHLMGFPFRTVFAYHHSLDYSSDKR
ncbi:hypothetical protein BGZ63DRAFT_379686 [Mariannaea sp. PMI_226]|nr:hypothetical protein BGZ63DRAFT_379686 [Mariannaea sp. PMI_226]